MKSDRLDERILAAICRFFDSKPQMAMFLLVGFLILFFAAVRGCASGG